MATDLKPPLSGYSIWLMPSEDDRKKQQQLIGELTELTRGRYFDAHATLIGLLDFSGDQEDQLIRGARALASSSRSITAELTGVGMRNVYFQSVFLHAAPNQQLLELNQAARILFGHQDDGPFMPHMSMVYGGLHWSLKKEVLRRITTEMIFPHTVILDRLALIRVDGYPNEWKIEGEYPFNK